MRLISLKQRVHFISKFQPLKKMYPFLQSKLSISIKFNILFMGKALFKINGKPDFRLNFPWSLELPNVQIKACVRYFSSIFFHQMIALQKL